MSDDDQPEDDPLIGTLIAGRYRVIKRLGEGGMGEVYMGEHEAIEKKVALKVLRPEYSAKADIVERFQQEAKAASRIKHPNVLDIFDFGQLDNGSFFLAMEFLEGNDLADELLKTRVIDPVRGIRYSMQICRALAAAHSRGVVHRDMKPENVFLLRTQDGEEIVKIVDFGIAQLRSNEEAAAAAESAPKRRKLTKTGMIFGTPEYMAPEQAAGKKADLRVDVYATAIILYEMFTGVVPHTGETFMAVLAKHLNDPPPAMLEVCPDIQISPEFQAVIMRGLAKKPEERYQSMAEFADAILSAPEAQGMGPMTRHGSIPDAAASQFVAQGDASHTAAQFAPQPGMAPGTHAQFPGAPGAPPPAPGSPETSAPHTAISPAGAGAMTAHPGAEERAQTHLDAATTPQVPKKGGGAGVAIGAVVALLAIGGGVAFYVTQMDKGAAAEPAPTAEPAVTTPPAATSAAPTPTPTPSAEPPEKKKLTIKIETTPEGAVVTKGGFEVCEETPCEIEVDPDEKLELKAKKGRAVGKKKLIASKDQTVSIKLVAPRAAAPSGPKMCEVMVDGLKILRPCPK